MTFVWIALGALGLVWFLWLAAGATLMRTATARHNRLIAPPEEEGCYGPYQEQMDGHMRWFAAQSPEEWRIESFDGLRLRARYLACASARGTIVCMHGYRGDPRCDFALAMRIYREAGYNVLLPDERAHWRSEGRRITYGVRERFDCRDWVCALNERNGGAPVFLHGVSMGAATVLMCAGLELPGNVRGVIADCGFTSPGAIFRHVLKGSYRLPAGLLVPAAALFTRLCAGFSTRVSTLDAMRSSRLPALFIHGADDDYVPLWMTEQNYAACRAEKELVVVAGAKHAQSMLADSELCRERILAFLARYA